MPTALKIWANSGDSHFMEPEDLWTEALPPALAELMPRRVIDPSFEFETIYVDGQEFRRRTPHPKQFEFLEASSRAPGSADLDLRLIDLDQEGIWAEVVFPSLGMWNASFRTREAVREAMKVSNNWVLEHLLTRSPRMLPTAQVSMISIEDAVAEMWRCKELGFRSVFMPTKPPMLAVDYHFPDWEPFWTACEEAGMVIAFHIGTDPVDLAAGEEVGRSYRGPGGAVLNYTETTFSGQRAIMKLVASGALDRHPNLKVLVSEGGAAWVPFLADRMTEGYRQHSMVVSPKLERSPREIMFSQVYVSFQHDETAVPAVTAMGYTNVLWGSDYPHLEGTYGHTQETLHHLFDGVENSVRDRVLLGAFNELFPDVPTPPAR